MKAHLFIFANLFLDVWLTFLKKFEIENKFL